MPHSDNIDHIVVALENLREVVSDLSQETARLSARMDGVERAVDRLMRTLLDGGNQALIPRVTLVEENVRNIRDDLHKIDKSIAPGDGGGSELARVELRRADAQQAMWTAVKGVTIATPGIVALVAEVLRWLR